MRRYALTPCWMKHHRVVCDHIVSKKTRMRNRAMSRLLQPGYRLLTSLVTTTLTFLLSPWLVGGPRTVLAWNAGVIVFLVLIATMMWQTKSHETLRRARKEETSNIVILLVTILAVAGALVDIAYGLPESARMSAAQLVFDVAESVVGVFLAWLLLHTMYSLHYAKLYYGTINDNDADA